MTTKKFFIATTVACTLSFFRGQPKLWKEKFEVTAIAGERESIGGDAASSKVIERKKIFYVCCTRAKSQLAVYYDQPSAAVIAKAEEWFGKDNIVKLPE